jgi:hypothetical protein
MGSLTMRYALRIHFDAVDIGVDNFREIRFNDRINVIAENTSIGKTAFTDISDKESTIELIEDNQSRILGNNEYLIINHDTNSNFYRHRKIYDSDIAYALSEIIENRIKVLFIDDFTIDKALSSLFDEANKHNVIILDYDRRGKVSNYLYKEYKFISNNIIELEQYLKLEEIYANNADKQLGKCDIIKTEDSQAGYNYWMYNSDRIGEYYGLIIRDVLSLSGIRNVYNEIVETKYENYLLCIDYAWDNIQVLKTLKGILRFIKLNNLNNIIISFYSYEQLIILSNLDRIEKYSSSLADDLEICITQFKDPRGIIRKYFNSIRLKEDNLFKTQEHFYKDIIPRLNRGLQLIGLELDYNALDLKYLYKPKKDENKYTNYFT